MQKQYLSEQGGADCISRWQNRTAELKKGKPTGAASAVDILMKAKAPPVIVKGRHRISSSDGGDIHMRPSIMAAAAQVIALSFQPSCVKAANSVTDSVILTSTERIEMPY